MPPPPQPLVDFWDDVPAQWNDDWFATPGLAVFDTLRLAIIAAAFGFLFLSTAGFVLARSRTQRALVASNMAASVLVVGVAYAGLGEPVSYRFPVMLVISGCGLWGSWAYLYGRNRLPAPAHPNQPRWLRNLTARRIAARQSRVDARDARRGARP
jgi:hypothetical protein